jgi:hypothetical protein
MPPLPPNISKTGIIRTVPSWEQRHFARRDNVIRFISRRFPNKPRDDPGLPNPPLPPGTTRLAYHKGSTRPGNNFAVLQWVAVAELPRRTNNSSDPISLAISDNSETLVAGYPNVAPDTGRVIAYSFSSGSGLSPKGQELVYTDGEGSEGNQEAGFSAAITSDGANLLVGIPSRQIGENETNGIVFSYKFNAAGPEWAGQGGGMYYLQAESAGLTNLQYGRSLSISDFDTSTARWYSVAGIPGSGDPAGDPLGATGQPNRGSIYVVSLKNDGEFSSNIGTDAFYTDAIFYGGTAEDKFGSSTDISNLTGGKIFVAAASHSLDPANSYVRMLVGTQGLGPDSFTWQAAPTTDGSDDSIFTTDASELSVRTTADGSIVVIGNPAENSVTVKYSTDEWETDGTQLGQTLQGIASSKFGASVAIDRSASSTSLEGTTIVIGQPLYSTPLLSECGRVVVMEYVNGGWRQVLNSVVGTSEEEKLGLSVAMREEGSFMAGGSQSTLGRAALYQVRDACAPLS